MSRARSDAASGRPTETDDVTALCAASDRALRSGDRQAALQALREAQRGAPERREPIFRLCAVLLSMGDPGARPLLDTCLARFPEASAEWELLADALLTKRQGAAALVCLSKGIPRADLSLRCGLLARDLGQAGEARRWFADATKRDAASPRAWFLLATAAQDARDFGAAAEAYRQVLRLDPSRAEAAVNLGIVLQETGDLSGAVDLYRQAVRTRADTFGRVAQALSTSPRGELWLDLAGLRRSLAG